MTRANIDTAIEKATQLFWMNGYGATTMRQLQHAMDMRPGSIYGAFGDKDTLYLRTLECYKKQWLLKMKTTMAGSDTAIEGLTKTISLAIFTDNSAPSDLCFLVKTVNELETRQPDLVSYARNALLEVRDELQQQTELVLAELGKSPEEISAQAKGLAIIIQAQIMGLKAQLKLNREPEVIAALVAQFVASIFRQTPSH